MLNKAIKKITGCEIAPLPEGYEKAMIYNDMVIAVGPEVMPAVYENGSWRTLEEETHQS